MFSIGHKIEQHWKRNVNEEPNYSRIFYGFRFLPKHKFGIFFLQSGSNGSNMNSAMSNILNSC